MQIFIHYFFNVYIDGYVVFASRVILFDATILYLVAISCMLQSIDERLATLETSVHSLRSEATFLRHVVTGQVNDQKILKDEVLKRMGVVTQCCERIENRLESVLDKRGITVQTNVKQSLLSCPKGCMSSALSEERSYCMEKK